MAFQRIAIGLVAAAACAATGAQQATPPTGAENAPFQSAFTRADIDSDGKLSKKEAAQLPTVAAKFEELDADRDGFLDQRECGTGYTAGS